MGDIIDCLNGFHYTSAKSMTFFYYYYFTGFYIHIRLLHNNVYPQSVDLPASVKQTSADDIYYKLLLLSSHTLSQKASVSSAAVFMLRKCSYFSFVCIVINKLPLPGGTACTVLHVFLKAWRDQCKWSGFGLTAIFCGHFRTRGDAEMMAGMGNTYTGFISYI